MNTFTETSRTPADLERDQRRADRQAARQAKASGNTAKGVHLPIRELKIAAGVAAAALGVNYLSARNHDIGLASDLAKPIPAVQAKLAKGEINPNEVVVLPAPVEKGVPYQEASAISQNTGDVKELSDIIVGQEGNVELAKGTPIIAPVADVAPAVLKDQQVEAKTHPVQLVPLR